MPDARVFCLLVLGDEEAARAAAATAAPDAEPVAGGWAACAPELERRRAALSWEEPAPLDGSPAESLPALPDLERGAVVAQAFGLSAEEVEVALNAAAGTGPALLARAHAALGGLGLPASTECAAERERLAGARTQRRAPRSTHCPDCEAFAAALGPQRTALRKAAKVALPDEEVAASASMDLPAEADDAAITNLSAGAGDAPSRAPSAAERMLPLLEPPGRAARAAVAVAVALAAGLVGFGAAAVLDRPSTGGGGSGVVTATPVGPLPPGVGATGP